MCKKILLAIVKEFNWKAESKQDGKKTKKFKVEKSK